MEIRLIDFLSIISLFSLCTEFSYHSSQDPLSPKCLAIDIFISVISLIIDYNCSLVKSFVAEARDLKLKHPP